MSRLASFARRIRRPLALAACAALVALASGIATHAAFARDLGISYDPNSGAFTIKGWSRRVAETGTIFYTCVDADCVKGSVVSFRRQQNPVAADAATLRRNEQQFSEMIRSRLADKVARVDIGEPLVTGDANSATGEITRTIVPTGSANIGVQLFWKTGYVKTQSVLHTLASSADTREASDANYDAFKFALMLSGAGQAGAPK
ncbi:hypothetical protein [Terrarubrum flagellatum]|uniref:hypothetical protein n=1 Tax=Terrirubrum flagellatum TaxID=2895980 RepID=UPI003144DBC6